MPHEDACEGLGLDAHRNMILRSWTQAEREALAKRAFSKLIQNRDEREEAEREALAKRIDIISLADYRSADEGE